MGQGVRIRDVATGAKWTPISEPDTMLVHVVAIKRRGSAGGRGTAAAATPATPAEPEVIKKGKTEKEEARAEAGRRTRQPRQGIPRHAAQRRFPGDRRARAARGRQLRPRGVRRAGGQDVRRQRRCILAKPLTFMNLSGQAVQALAHFHKVEVADLLVVADDVNLPLGRLRARRGGSAGGHNGFKSVAEQLGTDQFPRLRVGVGGGEPGRDLAGHVLGRFSRRRAAGDSRRGEPRGRCRGGVRQRGDRSSDEPVQR